MKSNVGEHAISRLCEICRRARAVATCRICGRAVCADDFDEERGICTLCGESLCDVCRLRLAVASCEICGRPVCDICGVQVTPVVWLCPDCASRVSAEKWPPLDIVLKDLEKLRNALRAFIVQHR